MKKLLFILCLMTVTLSAKAQFEKGTWFVNTSVTQFGLSYSGADGGQLGLQASAGNFLDDNIALILNFGTYLSDGSDRYSAGVGARYYFEDNGIYVGANGTLSRLSFDNFDHSIVNVSLGAEVGYAFFLSRNVTVEPAVYYDLSFKDGDYSQIGVKVGFGFYF